MDGGGVPMLQLISYCRYYEGLDSNFISPRFCVPNFA